MDKCKMVVSNSDIYIDKDICSARKAHAIETVTDIDTPAFRPPALASDMEQCQLDSFENTSQHHSLHTSDSCLHEMTVRLYAGTVDSDGYYDLLEHQGGAIEQSSLDLHEGELNFGVSDRVYDLEEASDREGYNSDAVPETSMIRMGVGSEDAAAETSHCNGAVSSSEAVSNDEILSHNASDPGTSEECGNEHFVGVEDVHASLSTHLEGCIPCTNNLEEYSADELGITMRQTWSKSNSSIEESSFYRVREWVNNIQPADLLLQEEEPSYGSTQLSCLQNHTASGQQIHNFAAVRSLHQLSTVAYMSGMGLQEVPPLATFGYLKTLNLSANAIVRIPAVCLPRTLHSLDLSRNKIAQIEGFRELIRLRILNLSHNRISRIGHGMSNCTLLKELNLSGNKICEVEGLHRLLKLSVLDLSFNKLPTSKAISQLSANYRSVLAINLIGNPVMSSLGDDSVRKLIVTLLPHVMYLNGNLIKVGSVRETAVDSVAKTVLGCLSKPNGKLSAKKLPGKQVDVGTSKHNSKNVKRKPRSISASGRVVGQQHPSRYRHQPHLSLKNSITS